VTRCDCRAHGGVAASDHNDVVLLHLFLSQQRFAQTNCLAQRAGYWQRLHCCNAPNASRQTVGAAI
jgi:hypothetical protein